MNSPNADIAMNKHDAPVFLIGCHRSGTTLIRFLLDAHPNIACPPESKFISALYEFTQYPEVSTGLQSLRLTHDEILAELGNLAHRLLISYARKRNKKRWIDKTPNYYKILPFLDDIFGRRPLFLFIVRHPLDTVASLEECYRYSTQLVLDREIRSAIERYGIGMHTWANYWNEVNKAIHTFTVSHAAARCHLFRYEDLIQSPKDTVGTILKFIDEPFCVSAIEGALAEEHDLGYQDPKVLNTDHIHGSSMGRWRRWDKHQIECLWNMVAPLGSHFGYTIDKEGA